MAMDDQKLTESFDVLWFFSNLLSPTHPPAPCPCSHPHTNRPPSPPYSKEAEADHHQTTSSHDPTVEAPAASAAAVGRPITSPVTASGPEAPGMPMLDQRRTRRRSEMGNPRRRRLKSCRREKKLEQLEEITDLGLLRVEAWRWDAGLPSSIDSSLQRTVRVYGQAASGRRSSVPCSVDCRLGDDLAVREQLRSWAHAVACTVR